MKNVPPTSWPGGQCDDFLNVGNSVLDNDKGVDNYDNNETTPLLVRNNNNSNRLSDDDDDNRDRKTHEEIESSFLVKTSLSSSSSSPRVVTITMLLSFMFLAIITLVLILLAVVADPNLLKQNSANSLLQQMQQQQDIINRTCYRVDDELKVRPTPSKACLPKAIHLAQASNVDLTTWKFNLTVSFLLDYDIQCDPRHIQPTVLYGIRHQNQIRRSESQVVAAYPLQFNYSSNKTMSQVYQSDYIYHVILPNLKAGKIKYWYKIVVAEQVQQRDKDDGESEFGVTEGPYHLGGLRVSAAPAPLRQTTKRERSQFGNKQVETSVFHFWSPPLPGQPTSLALVGDLGQTENSIRTMQHILQTASYSRPQPAFSKYLPSANIDHDPPPVVTTQLLIAGDMSYADSDPWRWPEWFATMQPLLQTRLVHVAAGNHEIECNTNTGEIFVPYEHYFRVPNRLTEGEMLPVQNDYVQTLWHQSCSAPSVFQGHYHYGNSYYSFTHGLARIVVLNSYTQTHPESTQYQFLERELVQANDAQQRNITPWLIVSFHCPFYTTFLGHVNEPQSILMRESMEPLFLKYKVNLIVSGHDHAYMRTHPMYNGTVVPNGRAPIYLTLGAGGNREGHAEGFRNPEEPEPWVVKRDISDYGYGRLFLPNGTHAKLDWVRNYATPDDDMAVHDSVWLINPYAADAWL